MCAKIANQDVNQGTTITSAEQASLSECFRDPAPFSVCAHGHSLAFLPGGPDRMEALLELIGSAQRSLKLCFYIFADDEAGRTVLNALIKAAQNGVSVSLIVDAFGSDAQQIFFRELIDAGGHVARFSPHISVRYLIRNHQKFLVADDEAAMIGGFNIQEDYFAPPVANGWNDLGIVVCGDIANQLSGWHDQLAEWCEHGASKYRAIRLAVRDWDAGHGPVQLLMSGPTRIPSSWARRLRRDLIDARRLDMVMAYFSPPRSYRRLIRKVPERGSARLIMAGKSDNGVTIGASRALYPAMLRHGVKLAEFEPCKLHGKLVVVDDVAYFGSSNFDQRSLRLNLELMVRIEDKALADALREYVDQLEAHTVQITPEWYARRNTIWNRLRWGLSWLLVGVLDYTVSRRLNLGL